MLKTVVETGISVLAGVVVFKTSLQALNYKGGTLKRVDLSFDIDEEEIEPDTDF